MPKKIEKTTAKKGVKKTGKKTAKKPVKKPVKKAPVHRTVRAAAHPKRAAVKTKKPERKKNSETERYIEAVGRRKTAVARVRLWTKGQKEFLINDKNYQDYFVNFELQEIILAPLEMMKSRDKFRISVKVKGGGIHSQAEAVRHSLSRALVKFNPDFRKRLKKAGFLTRDPRMRERKKFGLKRARRGPQWSKR